jgi:arylsulfatase A-like enzyme
LKSFFVAYALGAVVAVAALFTEWQLGGRLARLDAVAGYAVLGGLLVAAGRALTAWFWGREAGRVAVVLGAAGFAALDILYIANVELLAGEHFLSAKSVAVDAVLLAAVAGVAMLAMRALTRFRLPAVESPGVAGPALLVFVASLVALAVSWPRARSAPDRSGGGPDLLLVVMDSARRDHFGLHGYDLPISPDLDALAPQARVYEQAFSASSWTIPSISAILLASFDPHQGTPLASLLASRGYTTACFSDNPHLTFDSPLLRGFDVVRSSRPSGFLLFRRTVIGEVLDRLWATSDERLVDAALAWAAAQRSPFFLHVQLMDSHAPYRHPRLQGKRKPGRKIEFPMAGMTITADEREDIVARYDGGMRVAQAQAARLVRAAGGRRPTLSIVTSDHGESLGENDRWFHGRAYAPEVLAVPLIVLGDGTVAGRVPGPVGAPSIRRTFLQAAGLDCKACPGSDLRTGEGDESVEGALPPLWRYRVEGRYKLVMARGEPPRLFDLAADPLEQRDLAGEKRDLAAALAARSQDEGGRPGDAFRELRALGYVGI